MVVLKRRVIHHGMDGEPGWTEEIEAEGSVDEAHLAWERMWKTARELAEQDRKDREERGRIADEARLARVEALRTPARSATKKPPSSRSVPTAEDIILYIRAQPEFVHSLGRISRHFLGRKVSAQGEDSKVFDALNQRVSTARRKIGVEDKGEWIRSWEVVGGVRSWLYSFRTKRSVLPSPGQDLKPSTISA